MNDSISFSKRKWRAMYFPRDLSRSTNFYQKLKRLDNIKGKKNGIFDEPFPMLLLEERIEERCTGSGNAASGYQEGDRYSLTSSRIWRRG